MIMNNIFVCICWVFFRAPSFDIATKIFKKIFIWSNGVQQIYIWLFFALAIELAYVIWCSIESNKNKVSDCKFTINAFYFHHDLNTIKGLLLFFLEIMATIGLAYTAASPFIYFQF